MHSKKLRTARRIGLAVATVALVSVAGARSSAAASALGEGHRCASHIAYVANTGSGTVTPISTRTNTAEPAIPVGQNPVAIAMTPDGRTAYVANASSNTVTPISTRTNTAGPAIPVGDGPDGIAITPRTALNNP